MSPNVPGILLWLPLISPALVIPVDEGRGDKRPHAEDRVQGRVTRGPQGEGLLVRESLWTPSGVGVGSGPEALAPAHMLGRFCTKFLVPGIASFPEWLCPIQVIKHCIKETFFFWSFSGGVSL